MKKRTKLEELEQRIVELEKRPFVLPPLNSYFNQQQYATPFHYHGQMPCYNNPCVWC